MWRDGIKTIQSHGMQFVHRSSTTCQFTKFGQNILKMCSSWHGHENALTDRGTSEHGSLIQARNHS